MGFTKGSDAAKEHMAKIRAMQNGKKSTQSMVNNVEPVETNQIETPKRRGKLIKGSIEAREYMASIRSKKK
jgi:hypothetical protein